MGHVEVEGAVGLGGVGAVELAQGHVGEGVGEEDVVPVVAVLVEARRGELGVALVAVVRVAAVVLGPADLAPGDVDVEAEAARVRAGRRGRGGVLPVVLPRAAAPMRLAHVDGVVARVLQQLWEGERVGEGHLEVIGVPAGRVQGRLVELPVRPRAPRRLADALGLRARGLEAVGRPTRRVEPLPVRAETALLVHAQRPVGHAVAGGVHAAHQRATRGRAHRAGVGVGEEHPFLGQTLHVGRAPGVAPVQARAHRFAVLVIERQRRVLPPHVVDHEEDDVRALAPTLRRLRGLRGARGLRRGGPGGHRPHPRAQQPKKHSA